MHKERRARRRERTLTIARRRRDEHRQVHYDATTGLSEVDCVCELADTYFAKKRAFSCGCRKRRRGNPRVAGGMCDIGARDRIYKWRSESRELRTAARMGRGFGEPADRRGSTSAKAPRAFYIEKLSLSRSGDPQGSWRRFRGYRTETAREDALTLFKRTGGPRYDRGRFRRGDSPLSLGAGFL